MKSVATHQPNYIPWIGYFYKIHKADIFVFLDDVQFSERGLHHYHFLKTKEGPVRMRIPVIETRGDKINVVKIKNTDWKNKHLDMIQTSYRNAPYFKEIFSDFSGLLEPQYEYLIDLNIAILEFFCNKLGIKYQFVKSSSFNIASVKEQRIIDICRSLEADTYYSGIGAKAYQHEDDFINNGLKLIYSDYQPFEYPQQFDGFQSNVTILDFLMNCGYNWELVMKHQPAEE